MGYKILCRRYHFRSIWIHLKTSFSNNQHRKCDYCYIFNRVTCNQFASFKVTSKHWPPAGRASPALPKHELSHQQWRMSPAAGVLLRKLEAGIRGISHVIVDEIHERDINVSWLAASSHRVSSVVPRLTPLSVQTDFLLVVLRDVIQAYPEVRVVLMSATIDTSMFAEYFFNCPVIEVFGRTFPVQGTPERRSHAPSAATNNSFSESFDSFSISRLI